MPEYRVAFDEQKPNTLVFPEHLISDGKGWYSVVQRPYNSVDILGDRNGLLYLAEILVRCAVAGYTPGFHVHLALDSSEVGPNVDCRPELTIFAADPSRRV